MRAPASAPRLLVVTGMLTEARIAAGRGVITLAGGGRPERLGEALRLVGGHFDVVVSFGLAGGLDPALPPGVLVVASDVISGGIRLPVAGEDGARVAQALGRRGLQVTRGPVAAVDRPVMDPSAKRRLREETGAVAVDMESRVAAQFAAGAGLQFIVIRAIADPAGRALPLVALEALGADGRIRAGAVLAGLVRRPGELPAVLAAAADSRAAFAALRRCRPLAGLLFGLGEPDLG